jgi:hypothetical protein
MKLLGCFSAKCSGEFMELLPELPSRTLNEKSQTAELLLNAAFKPLQFARAARLPRAVD